MTERQILEALPAIATLNSFARVPYEQRVDMTDARTAIYAMKHRLIRHAIDLGLCKIRLVAVERDCKTCRGTGTYIWQDWNDEDHQEYQDCRRCAGTPGRVTLRFVETDIAGERAGVSRSHGRVAVPRASVPPQRQTTEAIKVISVAI